MKQTLQIKGSLIDLTYPKVMGIINTTPDSFFVHSRAQTEKAILSLAEKHLQAGATFLDIGGYSSRPQAIDISTQEELDRVIPAISLIIKYFPEAHISVDTFRAEVAKQAIEAGACLVNDISGGELDAQMFDTIAHYQVPYILMHMRGTPQTMQQQTVYEDILVEISQYFAQKVHLLTYLGVKDIILDVGLGFAKTITQNFFLLNHLKQFKVLDLPLLIGLSRKSMIWKTLQITPEQALNATTALHMTALQNGATILRVHDTAEAVETIKMFMMLVKNTHINPT